MSFCKDCISGVTHEGTPKGEWEKIGGVECYVGTPSVDYPKDKVLLFFTDVFGPRLVNAQLLVDDFATNGFKTIAFDYFFGDPVPLTALEKGGNFDVGAWFSKHGSDVTRPIVDKVFSALKEKEITTFYGTGYCFGARYVFDMAFENVLKASVVAHPSLLEVPKDLEARAKADEILGDGKFKPGYKQEYFPGCSHGFAVRGDMTDPNVKAGKEGAFRATVEWFLKYQ